MTTPPLPSDAGGQPVGGGKAGRTQTTTFRNSVLTGEEQDGPCRRRGGSGRAPVGDRQTEARSVPADRSGRWVNMNLGRRRKGSELGAAGVRVLPCDERKGGKDVPRRSWEASWWENIQEASFGHLDIGRALREEPGGLRYILCCFFTTKASGP